LRSLNYCSSKKVSIHICRLSKIHLLRVATSRQKIVRTFRAVRAGTSKTLPLPFVRGTDRLIFTKFVVHIARGRGVCSSVAMRTCGLLVARNGPHCIGSCAQWARWCIAAPVQSLMSANALLERMKLGKTHHSQYRPSHYKLQLLYPKRVESVLG